MHALCLFDDAPTGASDVDGGAPPPRLRVVRMKDQFNAPRDGYRDLLLNVALVEDGAEMRIPHGDAFLRRDEVNRTVRSRCASVTLRDVMPTPPCVELYQGDLKNRQILLIVLMAITQRLARICATILFSRGVVACEVREVGATTATVVWGLPESLLSAPWTADLSLVDHTDGVSVRVPRFEVSTDSRGAWSLRSLPENATLSLTVSLHGSRREPCVAQFHTRPLGGARPNIIFMLADDLGWADVCVYQRAAAPLSACDGYTPAIDALAVSGVRLTRHYAEPWCLP